MPRLTASGAIALVLFSILPAAALAGMGTTTDSSENQRPPEIPYNSRATQSDYDMGMRLFRHKQYADAIAHLQFALADKPKDPELLNDLGYAKRMVGDYDSSFYYYQRALGIDPNGKKVHENLGELYLAKSDLASAQKELATLATLCQPGCEEHDTLAKAIADYKPAASSTPTATTSAASPAATP